MPKSRHPRRKHKNRPQSLLFNVSKELDKIDRLIEAGDFAEALDQLHELAERAPQRAEVFEAMFYVAVQLDDKKEILEAAIRLTELQPNAPAHFFNLYSAYSQNIFPALALQTGRHFLSRWPDSELAKDVREPVDDLANILRNEAAKLQLPEDSWLETMVLHEKVQVALQQNHFAETRRLATQLIPLAPHFASPYNNRSLAAWAEGDAEAAISDARRVLEIDPSNVHALSNLTRFLRLTNRLDEAREIAERLKTATSPQIDVWTKKAEAFSYLGDDAAVLEIVEQADAAGALFGEYADPFFLHLAGVAAARLGDEKKARKLWQEAIQRLPSLSRAQDNLDDLDKPPGERDGPWAFEINDWLSSHLFEEFKKMVGVYAESKNTQAIQPAAQRYVAKYPQVMALVPALLERGDGITREFALRLAQMVEKSEAIAMIKDFVHSPHGTDTLRHQALQFLHEQGIFENGQQVKFWSRGQQTEVLVMNYRIDDEPYETLPPKAGKLHVQGLEALRNDDLEAAAQLFTEALAAAPNSASIQHNLSAIEVQRGNIKGARERLQALTQQHPQYAFGLCQLALIEIANNHSEEARDLLKRASTLEHFHYEEFAAYCKARLFSEVLGDEPNYEAAKRWLAMWEQLLPEDPRLDDVRPLTKDSMFSRMHARAMLAPLRE
jgi:Flp pilus assembly protein TadD